MFSNQYNQIIYIWRATTAPFYYFPSPPLPEIIMNRNQQKILEAKIKQSNEEKKILEQICSQLEGENAELKSDDHEAGRKARQLS